MKRSMRASARRQDGLTRSQAGLLQPRRKRGAPVLIRVFFIRRGPRRQLDPGVAAAVVDGDMRGRETGIGESAGRHAHRALAETFFSVEEIGPADGAEAKAEMGARIAGAHVLARSAGNLERRREARQRGEDAAGAPLAREAVAG